MLCAACCVAVCVRAVYVRAVYVRVVYVRAAHCAFNGACGVLGGTAC